MNKLIQIALIPEDGAFHLVITHEQGSCVLRASNSVSTHELAKRFRIVADQLDGLLNE